MDAVGVALARIKTTNGFHTNAGNTVYVWRTSPIDDSALPCIVYRDIGSTRIDNSAGYFRHRLIVEIEGYALGSATADDLRDLLEDIYTAIGTDAYWGNKWGGLAEFTEAPEEDTMELRQQDRIIGVVTVRVPIVYDTAAWRL